MIIVRSHFIFNFTNLCVIASFFVFFFFLIIINIKYFICRVVVPVVAAKLVILGIYLLTSFVLALRVVLVSTLVM